MAADPKHYAEELHKAMVGWGTDEKRITHTLVGLDNDTIKEVKNAYKHAYGKDLIGDIKGEVGGSFEELVEGILMDPLEYDAKLIRDAIKGLGTSDRILIEVLTSRRPDHIKQVHETFNKLNEQHLVDWLRGDTSGNYQAYLLALASGNREKPEKALDDALVDDDVKRLFNTGEGVSGTVEETWVEIFSQRNGFHLRTVNAKYNDKYNRSLETVLRHEFSGTLQQALLWTLEYFEGEWEFFAKRIHDSMVGVGTSDSELVRIFASQRKDLEKIAAAYHKIYSKTLQEDVEGETRGDFKDLLIAMITAAKKL